MSKGLKFAIFGCLTVIIIGVLAGGVGTFLVGKWFKKKTETLGNLIGTENSEYGKKMTELKKDYPFTPPAGDVITEDQLVRFLAVRKEVYQVWKNHEVEFKKMADQKNPDLSAPLKSLDVLNEVRMKQAEALAEHHMGPDEYRYLVQMVYITWIASGTKDVLKDKSITQIGKEQLQTQIDNLDKQIKDPGTNDEVRKQLQSVRDQLQKQLDGLDQNQELAKADEALNSIPQQDLDLFKKHEEEIKQYSMAGLELLGL